MPKVSQPREGMMRVSFAASADGMPVVDDTDIELPKGEDYVLTEADKTEIAEEAAGKVDAYTRDEIDAMFGIYINDIDSLIGGDT